MPAAAPEETYIERHADGGFRSTSWAAGPRPGAHGAWICGSLEGFARSKRTCAMKNKRICENHRGQAQTLRNNLKRPSQINLGCPGGAII